MSAIYEYSIIMSSDLEDVAQIFLYWVLVGYNFTFLL